MFGLSKQIPTASLSMEGGMHAYKDCNGCGVCTLSCPVWHQTHNVTLTLRGRVGALKGGASAEDLKESLIACVLCGACASVCPMGIDTVGMTIDLRRILNLKGESPLAICLSKDEDYCPDHAPDTVLQGTDFFLPGRRLRSNFTILNRLKKHLEIEGVCQAMDDGSDIAEAIEAGISLSNERIEKFVYPLRGAKRLIVMEGILHRYLRGWLPGVEVMGLGIALLNRKEIRAALTDRDFYVIEARGYNGDYDNMVVKYDLVRRETDCLMNLDLMRAAIPTGASGIQGPFGLGAVSPREQARWMLEERSFNRVVLESLDDIESFKEETKVPVIHVSELYPV